MPATPERHPIADALLPWYDLHARSLPWRVPPGSGKRPDPYRVWLSEVMLQQTTVRAVIPRYERFLAVWPNVESLACATEAEVLAEWSGLGYYARARNLHGCAREVVERHGGHFPQTRDELRALPGLGDYASASIAAIAFGEPVAVLDANVERVVSRVIGSETPPAKARRVLRDRVGEWVPADRPGDFAQATMDLGATICTPRNPVCALCPINAHCLAAKSGEPERFPAKAAKAERPERHGAAFVARRVDGAVLLMRRPAKGVLEGTAFVPTSGWSSRGDGKADASAAPFPADWTLAGEARHGFTHFALTLNVFAARWNGEPPKGMWWCDDPIAAGATTLLRRVLEAASAASGPESR